MKTIEYITLNMVSGTVIYTDVIYEYLPDVGTWLIILSIVFLNVARGIKALRDRNKKL